jgi:hypothetical protein
VGIPVALAYLAAFVLGPLTGHAGTRNDLDVYLRAAADLGAGRDPYGDFANVTRHVDPTLTGGYIYPPGLAWFLQPLNALPGPAAHALVAVALQLVLLASLYGLACAVGRVSGRLAALLGLMTVGFFPLWQNLAYQQVNLVLLALSCAWLVCWAADPAERRPSEVLGGLAIGASVAIKLIQAPSVLLIAGRRRWSMLLAAIPGAALVLLAGSPRLWEYATRVLPRVGQGTGWVLNQAPAALTARLMHPVSFYRTTPDTGPEVAMTAAALAVAVLAATAYALRRRPLGRPGRCLEVAAVVAAAPVALPLSWDTHLVLLLLPMGVLAVESINRRDRPGMAIAAAAWALMGPVHLFYLLLFGRLLQGADLASALATGHPGAVVDLTLRVGAELGPIAIVALWLGCLRAYTASYALNP